MNIGLSTQGPYTVAALHGSFDDDSRQPLADILQPLVADPRTRLAIDLSRVTRINSAGIAHLVALVSQANASGSRAVLVDPHPFVRSVLSTTRLDSFFEIYDSLEDVRRVLDAEIGVEQYEYVACESVEDVLVLTVTEMTLRDYEVTTVLGKEMEDAYRRSGANHVAVDLGRIDFLASPGYLPFLGLNRKVRQGGGRMVVFNLKPFIEEVFNTTRMLINPRSPAAPFENARDLPSVLAMLKESVA